MSSSAPASAARKFSTVLALGGLAIGTSSYILGSIYPPTIAELAFPRASPASPEAESPEGRAHVQTISEELENLDLVRTYRAQKDVWYETRPYESYPEEKRIHSLTAGTLSGPGKFAIRPLIFAKWDESESVVLLHVGRSLCGHDGIIHGGLLGTVLDETLARTALMNLPSKIGVTATLSINYKAPTKADQFIVVRTKLDSVEGRKAFVSGQIEDLTGKPLVQAKALFVEPKYAKMLHNDAMALIMGKKPTVGHPAAGIDIAVTS